ncbi:hypothetical protein D3C71_2096670 [compost metagenome]
MRNEHGVGSLHHDQIIYTDSCNQTPLALYKSVATIDKDCIALSTVLLCVRLHQIAKCGP